MLVPLGCTKVSQMGADGGRTRAFISHPEAGRPRGRCWPIGCLGVSPWLVHGPFALSSPGRETKNSGFSSPYQGAIPTMGAPPTGPHLPPTTSHGPPSQSPHTGWGLGLCHMDWGGCSVHSTKWISCYGGPRSGHTCPSGQCHGNTQTDAVECLYFFHGGFVPAHKMRQKPKPDKQKGSINC